jgi:hypothetical protein
MVPARILEDDALGGGVIGWGENPDRVLDARGDGDGIAHVEADEAYGADGGAHGRSRCAAVEAQDDGGRLVAGEGAGLDGGAGVVGLDDAEPEERAIELADGVEGRRVEFDGGLGWRGRHGSLRGVGAERLVRMARQAVF